MSLSWGRRYLMCPPLHYGVLYEINPWMHREVAVDRDAARVQWERLVTTLREAGAEVETMDPIEGLPDLVFTANAGLVCGEVFVVSRFRHPERAPEAVYDAAWFASHGWEVREIGQDTHFEGAGDALPFRAGAGPARFVAGYAIRSDFDGHTSVSKLIGAELVSLELTDPRLYHLDLAFCPLDERRAIVSPDAFDAYGRQVLGHVVPEPLTLDLEEALTFCANSVVVGERVVMPACPPRVGRQLEAWGFDVGLSPVDEFLKAGGGVRCLTLALDVPGP